MASVGQLDLLCGLIWVSLFLGNLWGCSVAQSYLTLCTPMDCSMPGFPVFHHFLELAQTHVPWVSDAIQPSHPLSSLLLMPSVFPSIFSQLFASGGQSIGASSSVLPMNSGLISFRIDYFDLLAVQGTLKSLLQHHSSKASILRHSAFFMVQFSLPSMTTEKPIAWLYGLLQLLIHRLGLSLLFFPGASIFYFPGCSHCLQWFGSPRK